MMGSFSLSPSAGKVVNGWKMKGFVELGKASACPNDWTKVQQETSPQKEDSVSAL
jgi:hypothetical protein